tara:strand:+ start:467 stop:1279 length:813 start_codon:yes stop_codon:yes gene_type:complete
MEDTFKHLLIGGSAACIARTSCAPLELFRLQRQNPYIPNTTLKSVIQKEGIRHLWKGNLTNCIRAFPQFAITWAVFQNSKKYTDQYIENSTISKLAAGGIAGGISQAIIYPLETTKTLLSYQTNKSKYSGVLDCLRKTPNKQLYRGLSVGLAMHIPWNSIQLTSFSYFKDKLDNHSYISPYMGKMLCGAAAGVTSITMVYPTDLIRRRMQIQGFDPSVPKYNTPIHAVKSIIKNEGFKGLYKGLWTNYPKTLATFSVQYLVLDTLNSYFK